MTKTELNLIEAAQEFGSIADSNCHYTFGLAARIDAEGVPLEQMTVGRVLEIHREHKEAFNRRCAG